MIELEITSLAAGGDGVGRDANGRVTFVPRTAPGDRIRTQLVKATSSFARGELVELIASTAVRVDPPCPHFKRGCGGCQWQHVARPAQLAAKQAIVAGALRKLEGLRIHPIDDPCTPLHWRRRARFHVAGGKVGLYREGTHELIAFDHCPQLEPRLDGALAEVAARTLPDGELTMLLGHRGDVAVGVAKPSPADPVIEIEAGVWGGPWDFAQASAAGNAALIARTREALGRGIGTLLELYAGAGNITRGLVEDGWQVTATDGVVPPRPVTARYLAGPVGDVVAKLAGPYDAIVLDPPRAGAAEVVDDIIRLSPATIVYVSCDAATLGRDAVRLVAAGYRATDAWPIDLMPQTSHVEVVLRLVRET